MWVQILSCNHGDSPWLQDNSSLGLWELTEVGSYSGVGFCTRQWGLVLGSGLMLRGGVVIKVHLQPYFSWSLQLHGNHYAHKSAHSF